MDNMDNMDFAGVIFAALTSGKKANDRIDTLPLPMVFKGSLGTGGTISTLPTASSENEGYVYIVITDGTYAGQAAKAGDMFISNGSAWVLVPSADEPSPIDDSVTSTALTWSSDKISKEFDSVKVRSFTYTGNGGSSNHRIDLPADCKMIVAVEGTNEAYFTRLLGNIPIRNTGNIVSNISIITLSTGTAGITSWNITFYDGYMETSAANPLGNLNYSNVVYTVYYI